MFSGVLHRASLAIRSAAYAGLGLVLVLVGLGFLTVSAWVALGTVLPPSQVALILGGAYVGLGLILFAVAALTRARMKRHHRRRRVAAEQAAAAGAGMAEAFLLGLDAGRGAARRRS